MTQKSKPDVHRTRIFADLTPLRTSPDYRRLWFGNTVSWIGQGMTSLAVSLQVYDLTGSAFSVGLIGFCSLVPLVVFGLYGGAIADTMDRRKLGLGSSTGSFLLSVALLASAVAGVEQVGLLYAIVALQAVCFALNSPARSSMIPRLLPPEQLPAANALSSLTSTTGTLVGPMLGGVIVGWWGYRAAYTVDAITFTASLYAMWRLPSMLPDRGTKAAPGEAAADTSAPGESGTGTGTEPESGTGPGGERPRERASVLEGLRFLGTRPNLRMTFFSDLCAMVLASPKALFPVVAIVWYHGDARTTGLLVAAPAFGALLGGVCSGWLGRVRRHGLAVVCAVACWGAAIAAFGLTRQLWLGIVFLALAGCADTFSMVFRGTMLQAAVPDRMRGRLQGVFIVVVAGGPRLGDFLAGSVSDLASPGVAVTGGGLACVVAVLLLALKWRGFLHYDARNPQP
ncbi:MFS transporter [Streptomyces sp. NBC_01335]|uniref:MFS transporter n=1 Tax=Streptomyces sp. NBC_01335 TaxID=2903828 RepID=UPI002E124735|nr:MFS transporter [Streptomyces sp. NBC_01335]